MPSKSKAKKTKKDDTKNLAKTDKRPSAKDKSAANKLVRKTKEQISIFKPKFEESISLISVTNDLNKRGGTLKQVASEVDILEEKSGPKILQQSKDDTFKKLLAEISLESFSSEPEILEHEAHYIRKHQKSFVANADLLMVGSLAMPESDDESESNESEETAEAVEAPDAAEDFAGVDGESTDEDVPEYLQQKPLVEEPDIFAKISDMPDVETMSSDVSVEKIKTKGKGKRKPKYEGQGDVGKFVDPLTGKRIMMPESDESEVIVVVKKVRRSTDDRAMFEGRYTREVKMLPPASDDEVSIDLPPDEEIEEEAKAMEAAEDTFNQFLELETTAPVVIIEEIDEEALLRAENERILYMQTYAFVQRLIDIAVEKAEYVDPKVILRQNLDKRKLLKEVREKLDLLEGERRRKQFLNRKCVEHFQRKRIYRPILPDNPKNLHIEYRKCQEAMTILDKWLIREDEAKITTQRNLVAVRAELQIEISRTQNIVKELEELINKTLKRESFDKLQQLVTRTLHQMDLKRQEISEVRFQMIEKQHDVATLLERLRSLEDLGNDLSMRDFETLHTETQTLSKKLEDRNNELKKLTYRGQTDIHRMAHMKEKQQMLRQSIETQRQYMDHLQMDKYALREFLNRIKLQRKSLRGEITTMSFEIGLLDKPTLMKDYDRTMEYLAVLKSRVEDSQVTIKTLNAQIKMLQQRYING